MAVLPVHCGGALGMHLLQRPAVASHKPMPHGSLPMNAEPSALQVRSVPSAPQVLVLGVQARSVQAPASSLQSAAEAQVLNKPN
jgi:hypothetical protein